MISKIIDFHDLYIYMKQIEHAVGALYMLDIIESYSYNAFAEFITECISDLREFLCNSLSVCLQILEEIYGNLPDKMWNALDTFRRSHQTLKELWASNHDKEVTDMLTSIGMYDVYLLIAGNTKKIRNRLEKKIHKTAKYMKIDLPAVERKILTDVLKIFASS